MDVDVEDNQIMYNCEGELKYAKILYLRQL